MSVILTSPVVRLMARLDAMHIEATARGNTAHAAAVQALRERVWLNTFAQALATIR